MYVTTYIKGVQNVTGLNGKAPLYRLYHMSGVRDEWMIEGPGVCGTRLALKSRYVIFSSHWMMKISSIASL